MRAAQMYHISYTPDVSSSCSVKKTTWIVDQWRHTNDFDFFPFLRHNKEVHERFCLEKDSINRRMFFLKDASISVFPNSPEDEKGQVEHSRIKWTRPKPVLEVELNRILVKRTNAKVLKNYFKGSLSK